MATAFDRARDFFLVAGARRRPEGAAHDELVRRLAVAQQKREAAVHLRRHGSHAEALLLAAQAFESATAATASVPPSDALKLQIEGATKALAASPPPELDDSFRAEHATLLEDVLDVTKSIESELADATLAESTARALRVVRPVFAGLVVLAIAVTAFLLFRKPPFRAEASAIADMSLPADRILDGDQKTEWALPDGQPGYIDVIPARPRFVHRLRVLNSKNLPGPDRGTKDFRIEVFSGGQLSKSIDGSFPRFTREGLWQTVDLEMADVQRVRIVVKSWFGTGGGLAEVVVE